MLMVGQFAGNALLVTVLVLYVKADVASVRAQVDALRETMLNGFAEINRRFEAVNQRFDDMRALWLAELHRVEGVLDARLKHLEQSREG
jgi:hypothetical protein